MSEKTAEAALFEQIDSVDNSTLIEVREQDKKPRLGDIEWTEYVLSFLNEKETVSIKNKNVDVKLPKTEGLRRICSHMFGTILKSTSKCITSPNEGNAFTATVEHNLIVQMTNGLIVESTGLADASERYLKHPFNQYVSANAATKAMGRAFRDLLQLQVLVADELNDVTDFAGTFDSNDPEDVKPLTDQQKKAIIKVCRVVNVDVDKFIQLGPFPHKDINYVLNGTARKMISVLNGYQSGTEIPENIKL